MLNLINDIESSLLNNNLRCALGMALTLPDICGQIEFPSEGKVSIRYIEWCEKYLINQGHHTHTPLTETIPNSEQRVISPEICYKLRCAYLHSGNLELNQKDKDNFPNFRLVISHPKDEGFYVETVLEDQFIALDIRHLTRVICNASKEYYNKHVTKKDFQSKHIHIIDITSEAEKAEDFFENVNDVLNREDALLDYNQLTEGAKKLFEDIKNGCSNVSALFEFDGVVTAEATTLMCQYMELIKGGFLIYKNTF